MLVTEKNRLSSASPEVHPRIQGHIAWLKEELNGLDAGLRQKIRRVRFGGRKVTCCAPFPAWENRCR